MDEKIAYLDGKIDRVLEQTKVDYKYTVYLGDHLVHVLDPNNGDYSVSLPNQGIYYNPAELINSVVPSPSGRYIIINVNGGGQNSYYYATLTYDTINHTFTIISCHDSPGTGGIASSLVYLSKNN